MMVLFTTLKPAAGEQVHIQVNALRSWLLLQPRPRVVVYAPEPGVRELVEPLDVEVVDGVARSPEGVPLIRDIFTRGFALGAGAYVNADIVLTQSFVHAFDACSKRFTCFMMIGRRHDVAVGEQLSFSPGWEQRLKKQSRPYSMGAIDYFAARANVWGAIPDLAVGRYAWDNWLVWQANDNGAEVVDVSSAALVFHQDHGGRARREQAESKRNLKLVGRKLGIINHAPWVMDDNYQIRKR